MFKGKTCGEVLDEITNKVLKRQVLTEEEVKFTDNFRKLVELARDNPELAKSILERLDWEAEMDRLFNNS